MLCNIEDFVSRIIRNGENTEWSNLVEPVAPPTLQLFSFLMSTYTDLAPIKLQYSFIQYQNSPLNEQLCFYGHRCRFQTQTLLTLTLSAVAQLLV